MTNTSSAALDQDIRSEVREFYDSVGWRQIGEGLYQNARYEDLRPVAQEYIRRCHLRVLRHLPERGKLLLDAGSGPIQYPEYLEYSRRYEHRVCLDVSRLALQEARTRIGDHGYFVVGDVSRLPFSEGTFDGVVSLHTVHHIPAEQQGEAFSEMHRVQAHDSRAVVVYSWGSHSPLMRLFRGPIRLAERLIARRSTGARPIQGQVVESLLKSSGTFTHHHEPSWLRAQIDRLPDYQIVVWRSVSTAFMRAFVHRKAFGKEFLRILYRVEELAPKLMGRWGQYPMIILGKPSPKMGGTT
jgi:SAM-dependent methyltransferase